jgi:hypothetical protein
VRQFFTNLVSPLAQPAASAGRSAKGRGFRPALEALEQRDVPSNVPVLASGILSMKAGDLGDQIHVKYDNGGTAYPLDDEIDVEWQRGSGQNDHYSFKLNGVTSDYKLYQRVKEIHVDGGNGNDTIVNDTFLISVLRGGKGNDTIKGGSAADLMSCGAARATTRLKAAAPPT